MRNLDLIKEEFIHFGDSPELRTMVKMSPSIFDWESEIEVLESCPYAFVSYLDQGQKRLICCSYLKDSDDVQKQNLVDLRKKQNPANFFDLVYIVSQYDPLYPPDSTHQALAFGPHFEFDDDFFDQLFLESRGYLVYNHQLERLYQMIAGCLPMQAINFRKALGKREAWAWVETELLRFPNGKTLKNIMDERMINEFTFSPNYHGAMNLYECCFR